MLCFVPLLYFVIMVIRPHHRKESGKTLHTTLVNNIFRQLTVFKEVVTIDRSVLLSDLAGVGMTRTGVKSLKSSTAEGPNRRLHLTEY